MNSTAFVVKARENLSELVRAETRGWGDLENTLRKVATAGGMPFSTLYTLWYRKPKSVDASIFFKLSVAAEAMRAEQRRRYLDERQGLEGTNWISKAFIRAADALAGEADGGEAE